MTAAFATDNLEAARRARQGAREGLVTRLRRAAAEARLHRSEREIAAFVEQNGGRLTDQLERRILDRALGLDRASIW